MRKNVWSLLTIALLAVWAALQLVHDAPSWLPQFSLLIRLYKSFMKLGTPEAGLLYALHHHVEMIAKVLALHLILAGAGLPAARWIAPRFRHDWLIAWGIGFGVISLLTLGWGLTGLLFPPPVLLSAAALGAVGFLFAAPGALRTTRAGFKDALAFEGPLERWLAVGSGAALVVLTAITIAPDTSWDALVYHLRIPAFYIQEHRAFYIPTHHFTAFPLAAEMHNTWLMLWGGLDRMGGGQAPKLFHLSCAVIAGLTARRLACRLVSQRHPGINRAAGWLALLLVLIFPLTGTIAVRTYNGFVLAALTGLALVLVTERSPGAFRLAGALCGIALSVKYTAVMVLGVLGAFWFWWRPAPYLLAAFAVAPWIFKNALLTGNPAAPFLTSLFPSSPESQFQLTAYADSVGGMSFNLAVASRAGVGLLHGRLLPMLLPAALLLPGLTRLDVRLAVFTAAFTALWMILAPEHRFFTPALAPFAALAAAGYVRADVAFGRWLRLALGVVLALHLLRLPFSHMSLFDPLPFTFGRETAWDHASRSLYPAPYFGHAAQRVNRDLPPDARLLLLVDIKSHYLWRRAHHDFQYITPGLYLRWLRLGGSVPGLLKKLRQEGVTHLLIVRQRTRDVGHHCSWRGDELALTAEFLAAHTVLVIKTELVEVLKVLRTPQPRRALDGYGWILFTHPENLLLKNRDSEVRSLMEETVRRAPWLRGARAYLGMALGRLQQLEEASRVLTEAAEEGGTNAVRSAYILGQIRNFMGDQAGAERAWREVIRLAHGAQTPAAGEPLQRQAHADAHYDLGILLHELGRKREALEEVDAAARLLPDNTKFARVRAEMSQSLGPP